MTTVEDAGRRHLERLRVALEQVSAIGEPEGIQRARVACRRFISWMQNSTDYHLETKDHASTV